MWRGEDAPNTPTPPRAPRRSREQGQQRHVNVIVDLDAEAAADVVSLAADLVDVYADRRREHLKADSRKRIVTDEINVVVLQVPGGDDGVVLERCRREAVEVQAVDVDQVRGFPEGLLYVAEFPHALPDAIGAARF